MDIIKHFERISYPCEEIKKADIQTKYPPIDDLTFAAMCEEFCEDMQHVKVFPFHRHDRLGQPFWDIYIWDILGVPNEYERFIIQKDKRLESKLEEHLDNYCSNVNMVFGQGCEETLLSICEQDYPEIHMKHYETCGHMIAHLYYTTHKGIKELFFKANLDFVGSHFEEEVSDYNLIGASPSTVLDGVPISFLRLLNSRLGIEILKSERNRKLVSGIYRKYGQVIPSIQNQFQWAYLTELYEADGKFNAMKYEFLGKLNSEKEYGRYLVYRELAKNSKQWLYMPKYPNPKDMEEYIDHANTILHYLSCKDFINMRLREIKREKAVHYEYTDEKYVLSMAVSLEEVLEESKNQKNCLWRYVADMVKERSVILFMRKIEEPDTSFITVEVEKGDFITQAYLRGNKLPEREELDWIYQYAWRFGFDTGDLEELEEDEYWDEE